MNNNYIYNYEYECNINECDERNEDCGIYMIDDNIQKDCGSIAIT